MKGTEQKSCRFLVNRSLYYALHLEYLTHLFFLQSFFAEIVF